MNVIVNLSTPLIDGTEVVFKAPCDAHEVTGLTVHYPNYGAIESQEFLFADAHANDVGDIADLFAKDAVVKVILDLDTHKAFVQNGDTNAYLEARFNALSTVVFVRPYINNKATMNSREIYKAYSEGKHVVFCDGIIWLPDQIHEMSAVFYRMQSPLQHVIERVECNIDKDGNITTFNRSTGIRDDLSYIDTRTTWSSRNIVDTLCPTFVKQGHFVQCEPMKGSIITVRNAEPDCTAFICGKNLYNAGKYPMKSGKVIRHGYGTYVDSEAFCATEDYIPIGHLYHDDNDVTISIRHAPASTNGNGTLAGIAFYNESKTYISGTNKSQATIPENAVYMRFSINKDYVSEAQIEIGDTVTDYAPYQGYGLTGALVEFNALDGINTIWSYCNDEAFEVTVSGKNDLQETIAEIASRIESLESRLATLGVATTTEEV